MWAWLSARQWRPDRLAGASVRFTLPPVGSPHRRVRLARSLCLTGLHNLPATAPAAMPPEFAQQIQQLFARQMAVAFLEHCAQLPAPVSLVNARIDELAAGPLAVEACALEAEFLLEP